jgi:hypothetical protein
VPVGRVDLWAKVSPGDVGVEGVATALAEFSPISTTITSGEQEVVRETDTVVPKSVPLEALPSNETLGFRAVYEKVVLPVEPKPSIAEIVYVPEIQFELPPVAVL